MAEENSGPMMYVSPQSFAEPSEPQPEVFQPALLSKTMYLPLRLIQACGSEK